MKGGRAMRKVAKDKNRKELVRTLRRFEIKPHQTRWLLDGEALPELEALPAQQVLPAERAFPEELGVDNSWGVHIHKGDKCAVLVKERGHESIIRSVALYRNTNPSRLAKLLAPHVFGEGADGLYPKALREKRYAIRWLRYRQQNCGVNMICDSNYPERLSFGSEEVKLDPKCIYDTLPVGRLLKKWGLDILQNLDFLGDAQRHFLYALRSEHSAFDWITNRFDVVSGVGDCEEPFFALLRKGETAPPILHWWPMQRLSDDLRTPSGQGAEILLKALNKEYQHNLSRRIFERGWKLELAERQPTVKFLVDKSRESPGSLYWVTRRWSIRCGAQFECDISVGTPFDSVVLDAKDEKLLEASVSISNTPEQQGLGSVVAALRDGPTAWVDPENAFVMPLANGEAKTLIYERGTAHRTLRNFPRNNIEAVRVIRSSDGNYVSFSAPEAVPYRYRFDEALHHWVRA
jgi:hypothetical protein